MTIDQVNEIAMVQSNRMKMIYNNFSRSNIESSFYKISLLPKISSSITFPYQRSISEVIQSDGSQKFIERNYLNSTLNFTISQALPFTGGSLSLTSSINGSRNFNNNINSFSSNWISISYNQTINGFNSFKWNRQLNYLNIKKDSIDFLKEKIKLKYEVSKLYLDTQLIQMKIELLKENIDKTEKNLIEIEQKFKYGRTIKIEVEQTKIILEQLKSQLNINSMEFLSGIKSLKSLMNYENDFSLKAIDQGDYPIDKKELKFSIKNNGFDLEKTIKLLESESNIEKVKKEGAISVNLQLGMGLNSTANDFANLYDTPAQSQFVTIGTKIPILDWGAARKKKALANLEKDYVEFTYIENEKKIDSEIEDLSNYKLSLILQKKSLFEQLRLSKTIDEMFEELLRLGRKTTVEYKIQLVETFNIKLEYQKATNDLYLLKLRINEINLIL